VNRVFGTGWRIRGLPRTLILGAARLLLAFAVICGATQSGAHYFYCEALGLSASDPCAAGARAAEPCPFKSLQAQSIDCCSIITLPSMPDGARAQEPTVVPAGVIALLPARDSSGPDTSLGAERFSLRAFRWERPPRPGGERRAQLMVFLT
jgi:hypothetical protein